MSYHVLIVDDDPAICKLLSKVMISNEMDPLVVNSGAAALDVIARQSGTLDMILMDITLGDMEGFDVIQTIRRNGVTTPVIIISGRNEDYDFMYGLSLGADDYVVKPFDAKEVVARVKAVLRRTQGKNGNAEESKKVVTYDKLEINIANYELKVNGVQIDTPPKELELIYHFASNPNRVFTRDQLLDEVWGFEFYGDSRTVDVHVKRLREKLEGVSDKWELKTVWGVGYKFETKE